MKALEEHSETATAAGLLAAVLLPVQASRSAAYGRLNSALRACSEGGREDGMDGYALACANCTEDLKLASEAADALHSVLQLRGKDKGAREAASIVGRVQSAEEGKMVALVSVHALKRSRGKDNERVLGAIRVQEGETDRAYGESYEEKVVRFSKRLASVDELIADLVEEAREMIADEAEGEDEG
jgi:hypothetical protein